MNYTETLKNYLKNHQGKLLDVGYEHETRFGMMDKKAMTRIIGRLAKEGFLKQKGKRSFLHQWSLCKATRQSKR